MASKEWQEDVFVGQRSTLQRSVVCTGHGQFPVMVRTGAMSLGIVYRYNGGHYGLDGTLATSYSEDGGRSWSKSIPVVPSGEDVRNPAFGINADGSWIVVYWKAGLHCYEENDDDEMVWKWRTPAAQGEIPALYVAMSHDQGKSWIHQPPMLSKRLGIISPFGRIIRAADGALLLAAYGRARDAEMHSPFELIVLRSEDEGLTWPHEYLVAPEHNEFSICVMPDGKILGAARHHSDYTSMISSADNGRTWTSPEVITRVDEHPADLTLLSSDKVLMTINRRRRPMGCMALLSYDNGQHWDFTREALIACDGIGGTDLGYPSTVQLADGSIVTAIYYADGVGTGPFASDMLSCQVIRYTEELFDLSA